MKTRLPSHFSELRRAAKSADAEDMRVLLLLMADEIEASYGGEMCAWCHHRYSSAGLPAAPCVLGVVLEFPSKYTRIDLVG